MLPDASARELLWTGAMLPGFALSVYNAWGATRDLRRHWRDGYQGMAWIGLVKASAILLIAVLILVSGGAAMLTAEPERPDGDDAIDFIAGCLIALDFLVLVLAVAFTVERAYVVPHVAPSATWHRERRKS